jgi:dihydrofolate synthase / folylpolyglutamate synthase
MNVDEPWPPFDEAVRELFARRPERMVPGLARIEAVCASLGDPQCALPAVHLTGTNGKTSLARMITAILQAHGHVPGTYTSPHLQDVRERVRVAGRPIGREEFVAALRGIAPALAEVEAARGEMVTFFETLTALAYRHFVDAGADVAVVEVGMGGRWDATNVLDAEVAVINPVRLDHAELGSTVGQVAREKAGIISEGGTCVSAEQWPDAKAVIVEEAAARRARLVEAGVEFALLERTPHESGQRLTLAGLGGTVEDIELPLHGAHQAANAAVALAAVEALRGSVDPEAVRSGFSAVRTAGRFEVVPGAIPVILDGAHNPAGAEALATAMHEELSGRRTVIVVGAMGDKDCGGIIDALLPVADGMVCSEAPNSRAAPAESLAKLVKVAGHRAEVEPDVGRAIERARTLAGPGGMVVVTGSLYLVGAARDALGLRVG